MKISELGQVTQAASKQSF